MHSILLFCQSLSSRCKSGKLVDCSVTLLASNANEPNCVISIMLVCWQSVENYAKVTTFNGTHNKICQPTSTTAASTHTHEHKKISRYNSSKYRRMTYWGRITKRNINRECIQSNVHWLHCLRCVQEWGTHRLYTTITNIALLLFVDPLLPSWENMNGVRRYSGEHYSDYIIIVQYEEFCHYPYELNAKQQQF